MNILQDANLIGWIGNFFFVIGAYLLAKKKLSGWCCQVLGNLAYLFVGIALDKDSLWVLSVLLIIINFYGIYKWKKKINNKLIMDLYKE